MCLRRTHLSGLKKYKRVNEGQPTIVLKAAKLPRVATCDGSNITTRPRNKSKRTRLRPKTKVGPKARDTYVSWRSQDHAGQTKTAFYR